MLNLQTVCKDEILQNPEVRDWAASNLLAMKSLVTDTIPYWQSIQKMLVVERDLEDCPPWRDYSEKVPAHKMLFQTRAPPYNHHPAIHCIIPGAVEDAQLNDEQYQSARYRNTLQYPHLISIMTA